MTTNPNAGTFSPASSLPYIHPNDPLPEEYNELLGRFIGASAHSSRNLINIIRAVIAVEGEGSLKQEMYWADRYESLLEEHKALKKKLENSP